MSQALVYALHAGEVAEAKVLAATILDLLASPDLRQKASAQFEQDTKETKYFSLLPADAPITVNGRNLMNEDPLTIHDRLHAAGFYIAKDTVNLDDGENMGGSQVFALGTGHPMAGSRYSFSLDDVDRWLAEDEAS